MGWSNQQFELLIVTSEGGPTGLFVYSPTPGFGNLIFSVTGPGTTVDPFGNTVHPVASSYVPSTGQYMDITGAGFILADPANLVQGFLSELAASPAASAPPSIVIEAPTNNTTPLADTVVLGLLGTSQDGTSPARILLGGFNVSGAVFEDAITTVISTLGWAHTGFTGAGTHASLVARYTATGVLLFGLPTTSALTLQQYEFQGGIAFGPSAMLQQQASAPTVPSGFFGIWADTFGDIHFIGPVFLDGGAVFVQLQESSAPGTPSGAGRLYVDTSGVLHYLGPDGNSYVTQTLPLVAPGTQVISSATLTPVTGIGTVSLAVGTYTVRGVLSLSSVVAGGKCQFELVTGGGLVATGSQWWNETISGSPGSPGVSFNVPLGSLFSGLTTASTAARLFTFDGTIVVTTAGTVTLEASTSVAADTFTIGPGSYMEVRPCS